VTLSLFVALQDVLATVGCEEGVLSNAGEGDSAVDVWMMLWEAGRGGRRTSVSARKGVCGDL
jgi:hypothetical protein